VTEPPEGLPPAGRNKRALMARPRIVPRLLVVVIALAAAGFVAHADGARWKERCPAAQAEQPAADRCPVADSPR
jgi:hypothetical protein